MRRKYSPFGNTPGQASEPRKKPRIDGRKIPNRSSDEESSEQDSKPVGSKEAKEKTVPESNYSIADTILEGLFDFNRDELLARSILKTLETPPTRYIEAIPNRPRRGTYPLYEQGSIPGGPQSTNFYHNPLCWLSASHTGFGIGSQLYSYATDKGKATRIASAGGMSDISALACNGRTIMKAEANGKLQFIDSSEYREFRQVYHYAHHLSSEIRLEGFNNALTQDCFPIYQPVEYSKLVTDGPHCFYASSRKFSYLTHFDPRTPALVSSYVRFNYDIIGFAFNSHTYAMAISDGTLIRIYDTRNFSRPTLIFSNHKSPTKALEFSPYGSNILASGGGRDDKTLQIWNTQTGEVLGHTNVDSQVANVHWFEPQGLFITQGFGKSGISTLSWIGSRMKFLITDSTQPAEGRVLFSAQNPNDKKLFVTGGEDNMFRFWSVKNNKPLKTSLSDIPKSLQIKNIR